MVLKFYCFESEILYCPQFQVVLLVFEKFSEHVFSGSNNNERRGASRCVVVTSMETAESRAPMYYGTISMRYLQKKLMDIDGSFAVCWSLIHDQA